MNLCRITSACVRIGTRIALPDLGFQMDGDTGKRVTGRFSFARSGSSLSFRDPNKEDRSIQYCSRSGCSSRPYSTKGNLAGNQEKLNYPKSPFRSTSSKAIAGSSSGSFSCSSDFRKTHQGPQNHLFLRDKGIAESSRRRGEHEDVRYCSRQKLIEDSDSNSKQEETDDSESSLGGSSIQTALPEFGELDSAIFHGAPVNMAEPFDICTDTSSSRPCKQYNRRVGSAKQDTSTSSVRRSLASRSTFESTKHGSPGVAAGMGNGAPRYGLKNLGCTSISDVLPSGCSSSESGYSRKVSSVRRRPCDGGSSSNMAREISRSSNGGSYSASLDRGLSGLLSERSFSQQTSRGTRNQPANRDAAVSVRTRRSTSGETRMRLSDQELEISVTPASETVVIPRLPQNQLQIRDAAPESSLRSSPAESLPVFRNTSGRPSSAARSARTRPSSRLDGNSTQIFRGPPRDTDGYGRFNMEGIAEVLLALERIEQDEELSYEQLLVLETNLFLGGLSFHDQHRDMRMDIDNMSYEELLALEEKMGIVSTALSEEALVKCLKRSVYAPATLLPETTCRSDDDIKCSICQEEYVAGDELGELACKHHYHLACIDQWLRQKNRCPICKASVPP